MLAGGMKEGRQSLEPEEEALDIDLSMAKIGGIATEWQKWFGGLEGFALRYHKINLAFVPLGEDRFLVFSTDPDLDPFEVVAKLRANKDYRQLVEGIP